jgi:hypothetical protein
MEWTGSTNSMHLLEKLSNVQNLMLPYPANLFSQYFLQTEEYLQHHEVKGFFWVQKC